MLRSFKGFMGTKIQATDGSLGNAIRFFVDREDWSLPLVMVGGGLATTGELMVPTQMVEDIEWEDPTLHVSAMRRSILSSGNDVSGDGHDVFDALRLMGAHVTARGEDVGKVVDLMVDVERPWTVRYLVVNVEGQGDREVLFSTEWVSTFSVERKLVDLDVPRGAVNDCPECDLERGVEREYERRLHEHYEKPVYLARFG
ncbi:MAG: hypothetical protein JSW25_09260 [Thermoplasmata archaeon]|nr:MAG: hypothetical protein JSW25_09260 [Thermoplasmata archaeon]